MAVTINGTSGLTFNDSSTLPSATFSTVYPIVATVATNAMTVTLNPCSLAFRNSTLTTGTTSTLQISTALTVTIPAAQSFGIATTGVTNRYVILCVNNSGTPALALSLLAGGVQLDETNLVTVTSTTTNTRTTVYSSITASNISYRVVGIVDVAYTSGTGYSVAPTLVQGYGGNAVAAMSSLGYGQTYSAPTRALATTYYNTTGKPITCVVVGSSGAGNYGSMSVSINGATAFIFAQSQNSSGTVACSGTFIVPANVSYIVTANNIGLGSWNELR
jgi:hypothetical protein